MITYCAYSQDTHMATRSCYICALYLCNSCGFVTKVNNYYLQVLRGEVLCNRCYSKYSDTLYKSTKDGNILLPIVLSEGPTIENRFIPPELAWQIAGSYMMRDTQEKARASEYQEKIGSNVCPHVACTGMDYCKWPTKATIRVASNFLDTGNRIW